jgi:hypothetical protein
MNTDEMQLNSSVFILSIGGDISFSVACHLFMFHSLCFSAFPPAGTNFSDTELMQYRCPVGWSGASLKMCPRCEPHRAHVTSTRVIPWL